jgi:hypothetical protein
VQGWSSPGKRKKKKKKIYHIFMINETGIMIKFPTFLTIKIAKTKEFFNPFF